RDEVWIKWYPPLPNFIKINTDGSSIEGWGARGGVLCNHEGLKIIAFANYYGVASNMEAEGNSLKDDLMLTHQHYYYTFQVKSDCKLIVDTIVGNIKARPGRRLDI
ncbi:hypothetical protein CFOL_v3_12594, partial [Cephalotus follicularis]